MIGSVLVNYGEITTIPANPRWEVRVNGILVVNERDLQYTKASRLYSTRVSPGDTLTVGIFGIPSNQDGSIGVYRKDYTTDDEGGDNGIKITSITGRTGNNGSDAEGEFCVLYNIPITTRPDAYGFEYIVDMSLGGQFLAATGTTLGGSCSGTTYVQIYYTGTLPTVPGAPLLDCQLWLDAEHTIPAPEDLWYYDSSQNLSYLTTTLSFIKDVDNCISYIDIIKCSGGSAISGATIQLISGSTIPDIGDFVKLFKTGSNYFNGINCYEVTNNDSQGPISTPTSEFTGITVNSSFDTCIECTSSFLAGTGTTANGACEATPSVPIYYGSQTLPTILVGSTAYLYLNPELTIPAPGGVEPAEQWYSDGTYSYLVTTAGTGLIRDEKTCNCLPYTVYNPSGITRTLIYTNCSNTLTTTTVTSLQTITVCAKGFGLSTGLIINEGGGSCP
jgi:hypothetical protein